ncbi:MAG: hypothetical protein VXX80_08580 [Bacteroidota bacterium]|nr:hypothetical protein [Bacteroidota bacterium]
MKKILLLILLVYSSINAQVLYESVPSSKFNEPRNVKIQLPRNYEANEDKYYPVILVLDGDYLFEPVAGSAD